MRAFAFDFSVVVENDDFCSAPVAQLDRVTVSEAVGCGFDPRRVQIFVAAHFGVAQTGRIITLRNLSFPKATEHSKPMESTKNPQTLLPG